MRFVETVTILFWKILLIYSDEKLTEYLNRVEMKNCKIIKKDQDESTQNARKDFEKEYKQFLVETCST
jgi:hypothetical protein